MRAGEAAQIYHQALAMSNNTPKQKASLHKNLSRAYAEQERYEEEDQLKLWHFDRSLEHIDKALYFGSDSFDSSWSKDIVEKHGGNVIARLKSLLVDETSQTKADYMEKMFCKMNIANCDLLMRIAWYVSKAYYK